MVNKSLPKISASILAIKKIPEKLVEQSILALKARADMIHFDVIKGKGTPTKVIEKSSDDTNSLITPRLLQQIRERAQIEGLAPVVDVHIMDMEPNESVLQKWINAGADYLSIHWEAFADKTILRDRLLFIKDRGVRPGLAIRPDINTKSVIKFLADNPNVVNLVSQCGVYPCIGGQTMAYHILHNVQALDKFRKQEKLSYEIMVDGGIRSGVLSQRCFESGADILVAGSAFFGKGNLGLDKLFDNTQALKQKKEVGLDDTYTAIADRISEIRAKKKGKVWVLIEGYHGSGKTFTTGKIEERLISLGLEPVVISLDFSWTNRRKRARWKDEAYNLKPKGGDHNYFHSINQVPEPMHWRAEHSKQALVEISSADGRIVIENCYQFNETGDTKGRFITHVTDNSVLLVEGVYASLVSKDDWDMKVYISGDKEAAKQRAMVRDETKVYRPPQETAALYNDVYEPSYKQYVGLCDPMGKANIVIGATNIIKAEPFMVLLECTNPDCRRQYPAIRIDKCKICSNDLDNVIVGKVNFLDSIAERKNNMWRYRALTPLKAAFIVSDKEGNTPIVYLQDTSNKLGVHLWIKLETVNPTGTFKDREASYVVSLSRQYGQDNIVMQSTGNTAVAITHYAGLADISSWCFIPESSCYKMLMPPKKSKNRIIAVKGHPTDVKVLAENFANYFSFPKISPFYERCEANVTMAYEIGEAIIRGNIPKQDLLKKEGFDYYVQTISAGMGVIGFFYGMKRLHRWTQEKIKLPHILGVEISEFAPIHYAWERDLEQVGEEVATPYFPNHLLFEPTLWTTNIRKYYPHLRRAAKESGGMLTVVKPEEVKKTIDEYGILKEIETMGYRLSDTEKSSFIGFAGMVKKVESGEIPRDSCIILMLTGKGYHDNFIHVKPDFIADPKIHKPQDIIDRASE